MGSVKEINARYESVKAKLSKSRNCTSLKIHAGVYGAKASDGTLWRVLEVESVAGYSGWVAVDYDNDHVYTDSFRTKRDVLNALFNSK